MARILHCIDRHNGRLPYRRMISTLLICSIWATLSACIATSYPGSDSLASPDQAKVTGSASNVDQAQRWDEPVRLPPTEPVGSKNESDGRTLVSSSTEMQDLTYSATNPAVTLDFVVATPLCLTGFAPGSVHTRTTTAATPLAGGVFHSSAEVDLWRSRLHAGPFLAPGDYKAGSPGDWARITANAREFFQNGERSLEGTQGNDAIRTTHGTGARDAAFTWLLRPDTRALGAIREFLLNHASSSINNFSSLCFHDRVGPPRDAWFGEAAWLLRYLVTYDYVRSALSIEDQLSIENFIRLNAYYMAAHLDWGGSKIFPRRLIGDYAIRSADAALSTQSAFARKRVDANGDCHIDSSDPSDEHPIYAYVRLDGSVGPRISKLSQWFNNRKSMVAAAVGSAGILLNDTELTTRAKRYFMEWLTFSVWPDGSEGEYYRNLEYCIPKQGVIYAAVNGNAYALLASALARQGDFSLIQFRTWDGMFGTEAGSNHSGKSLDLVFGTHFKLGTGSLPWYAHEPQRIAQLPREQTFLGRIDTYFNGSSKATENFQELGMIHATPYLSSHPFLSYLMRVSELGLRFPGATGSAVSTGWGSWTDAMNALPAAYLLRP